MNFKSQRGFSLVELMIVVAIIGILAAIAIPNFMSFQVKARQSEARADLSAVYAAEKAFAAEWQQYFGDLIEIGYVPEGSFKYEHGFSAIGIAAPATYTGRLAAGANPTHFSTAQCGTTPLFADYHPVATVTVNCSVDRAPRAGAPIALGNATVNAATTFTAAAHGNIDSDAASDIWQISQDKQIAGPCSATRAFPCAANGGDLSN